jgi:DNA-binding transcriptional MocR family regulator
MGWIEADESMIETLAADGEVVSGSFTSPLVESLIALLVESGEAQAHMTMLQGQLAKRAALLADAINGEQPAGAHPIVQTATAGYFLWVRLQGLDAVKLRAKCELDYDVSFLPGPRCALEGSTGREAASTFGRVCFAFLEEDALVEAGRRLGQAIAKEARRAA